MNRLTVGIETNGSMREYEPIETGIDRKSLEFICKRWNRNNNGSHAFLIEVTGEQPLTFRKISRPQYTTRHSPPSIRLVDVIG